MGLKPAANEHSRAPNAIVACSTPTAPLDPGTLKPSTAGGSDSKHHLSMIPTNRLRATLQLRAPETVKNRREQEQDSGKHSNSRAGRTNSRVVFPCCWRLLFKTLHVPIRRGLGPISSFVRQARSFASRTASCFHFFFRGRYSQLLRLHQLWNLITALTIAATVPPLDFSARSRSNEQLE